MSEVALAKPQVDDRDLKVEFGQPVNELYREPSGYDPGGDLRSAVEVSLLLGLPLLLTGEPGCGKTSVAHWLAWYLDLGAALVHNVKSSSIGRDLLYEFDELLRFRDSNAGEKRDPLTYLRLNALGLAILLSGEPQKPIGYEGLTHARLAKEHVQRSGWPGPVEAHFRRHVVLIDELDKAPRDTPNDLLAEIEHMEFRIRELDQAAISGQPGLRPVVVITSNSEKSLPEPFLRRCVFHHMRAPDDPRRREIVERRRHPFARRSALYDEAMRFFDRLRVLSRSPGTAELLAWLTALEWAVERETAQGKPVHQLRGLVRPSLGALAKTKDDLDLAEKEMVAAGLG